MYKICLPRVAFVGGIVFIEKIIIQKTNKIDKTFHELCHKENIENACSFNQTGNAWFSLLFITMLSLLFVSIILMKPQLFDNSSCIKYINDRWNKKIYLLSYVQYIMIIGGIFCMISIIPIATVIARSNDICRDNDWMEWNNDNDDIYVDNLDEPLWTMYSSPVIGVFVRLNACFIAQIKSKPQNRTDF